AALDILLYPLSGYAFDGETDRAVAVSSFLTPFVRPSIPLAPGFAIDAPLKGSGKTKLASLLAISSTGEPPPLVMPHERAEELDKRFAAALLGGTSSVVLDNISGETWGTDTICAAITAEVIQLRPLQTSNAQNLQNKFIVTVTGNNLTFPGDTARRFLICRI